MFLTDPLGIAVFNLIRAAMKFSKDAPGAGVSFHELSNKPALGLGFCRTTGKDLVAGFISTFTRTVRVDVFPVVASVMMDEFFRNETTS